MQDLTEAADEGKAFFELSIQSCLDEKLMKRVWNGRCKQFCGNHELCFTRTPSESQTDNIKFVSEDVKSFVENLKRQNGKNILLMGAATCSNFFAEKLIDEIIIGVHPLFSAKGYRFFFRMIDKLTWN
jgi:dihydrofolate reductase